MITREEFLKFWIKYRKMNWEHEYTEASGIVNQNDCEMLIGDITYKMSAENASLKQQLADCEKTRNDNLISGIEEEIWGMSKNWSLSAEQARLLAKAMINRESRVISEIEKRTAEECARRVRKAMRYQDVKEFRLWQERLADSLLSKESEGTNG